MSTATATRKSKKRPEVNVELSDQELASVAGGSVNQEHAKALMDLNIKGWIDAAQSPEGKAKRMAMFQAAMGYNNVSSTVCTTNFISLKTSYVKWQAEQAVANVVNRFKL